MLKNKEEIAQKQKKLYLILYIILAIVFLILILDLLIFILVGDIKNKTNLIKINLENVPTELKQEIDNLIK
ncbi:MAG: hypothetical protein PHW50_02365 [Patescibacteria group bacterium]|nr:hypothetical protein [Patescibacteria group bacterium]